MQPYYSHNGIALYLGDCLEIMPELPDQSIDAVICDPPYGTTECPWDAVIPFAPMWAELRRITKPCAAVVLSGSQPFTSSLVMSNLDMFGYEIIWDKKLPTGYLDANRKPLKRHENILLFYNGRTIYNPIMRKGIARTKGGMKAPSPVYSKANSTQKFNDDNYYPTSIIEIGNTDREGLHPTQKPLPLMRYLIQTYTHPGDTVLDFACGSGTTLRAAKDLGRKAIGIEIKEDYAEIAARKLSQEVMELI